MISKIILNKKVGLIFNKLYKITFSLMNSMKFRKLPFKNGSKGQVLKSTKDSLETYGVNIKLSL